MTCIEKFAMQWGSLGNHAVVDISEPNEHDLHHYYGDACDRIRERIINAQIRCLRRCFLNRRPTKKSIYFDKSCEYIINRDDGGPPVKGHLGFLTTDDFNVYQISSKCSSKNLMDESTIQYHLGKILAVIRNSGINHANLKNFVTSQLRSQLVHGRLIPGTSSNLSVREETTTYSYANQNSAGDVLPWRKNDQGQNHLCNSMIINQQPLVTHNAAEEELGTLEGKITDLEGKLETATNSNAKLTDQVASLQTANEDASKLLAENIVSFEHANSTITTLKDERSQVTSRLFEEATELRNATGVLETNLEAEQLALQELKRRA
eukprot:CAMPEP_0201875836 /NCGR_PEP_ID=MMETSP0902-20130614/7698_1 /ASSEMBLY_ACC=CAM_ASM_000551 /TAXON_ID=420261 /ORGANISM="Thalassiosira antarctica, Strain CCMP982" /LENGTH=320 /DNA_ID=CAMNT_0048402963 /DNA_START=52 /DNA_END=1011 /DNA_ORIENTATION=-